MGNPINIYISPIKMYNVLEKCIILENQNNKYYFEVEANKFLFILKMLL